jgi:hypothetical protein
VASEKADGSRGDRQQPFGWGLARYREEIDRLEGRRPEDAVAVAAVEEAHGVKRPGWELRNAGREKPKPHPKHEVIFRRLMDARAAANATARNDRAVTLLEECAEAGMDFEPVTGRGGDGTDAIDEGVNLINDWLDFDTEKDLSFTNKPRLYVSEECPDVIYALREWTGIDGKHGACKDPVDCVRYLIQAGGGYVSDAAWKPQGGGHY